PWSAIPTLKDHSKRNQAEQEPETTREKRTQSRSSSVLYDKLTFLFLPTTPETSAHPRDSSASHQPSSSHPVAQSAQFAQQAGLQQKAAASDPCGRAACCAMTPSNKPPLP